MIDRLGAQLNEPMTMPEFLQNGAALGIRPINTREFVLEQEIKNRFRITSVGLLPRTRALPNFGCVADPDLMFEFKEQIFKPLAVASGFQSNDHFALDRRIELTNLIHLRVIEFGDLNFAVLGITPNDELLSRVKINATISGHSDSFHFSNLFNREHNNSQ